MKVSRIVLAAALAKAAKKTGATYVDTYGPSLGHDACAGSAAWVNGQYTNLAKAVAYHPVLAGMRAEAGLIHQALAAGPERYRKRGLVTISST